MHHTHKPDPRIITHLERSPMRRSRPSPIVLLVVLIALLAAACGGSGDGGKQGSGATGAADAKRCPVAALDTADGPVPITFWHAMTAANEKTLQSMVDDYNAGQKRVKVRLVFKGTYTETLEGYRAAARTGDLPNLVQLEETAIQQLVDSKTAIPAAACIKASGFDTSDILPRVLDEFTVANTLWPMPFNTSNPVLYFNKKAFTAAGLDPNHPPSTLAELKDASRAIVDSGAAKQGFALEMQSWYLEQLFATSGEPVVDKANGREARATSALLDNPAGQAVFSWAGEMLKGGLAANVGRNPGGQDAFLAIASGDAAMTLGTSAALGSIYDVLASNPDIASKVELGVAPMPTIKGSGRGGVNVGGAALWIADTGTDAQKAATWDFASWLSLPKQQARWHVGTGYVPISKAAATDPIVVQKWTDQPGFRVAYDQLAASKGPAGPVIGGYPDFREAITQGLERVADGADPKQSLTEAEAAATAAIRDYNRRVGS
jgi:sn-glycerol 3-phosphate transport system substrate-binding protein